MKRKYSAFFLLLPLLLPLLLVLNGGCVKGSGVEIRCDTETLELFQGEKFLLSLEITNHLPDALQPGTNYFISYHIYDRAGQTVVFDNRRFPLPGVLPPGRTTRVRLPVFFGYSRAGRYIVEFDIVKEGEFWGSGKNWKTCKIDLNLKSLVSPEFKDQYLSFFHDTGHELLNREQYLLRMTFKNCEIRTPEGKIFGFSPGSDYPAVWIRDTATFIGLGLRYYPVGDLVRGVELFFEHQGEDGEVVDWVALSGETGKNTVETDQESSLVLAAGDIAAVHPEWLRKKIKGASVLDRLEAALQWVWQNKRNPEYNLIISAFTADWGDVDNTYPDQRATRWSDRSTPVLSIYTQARYIQAVEGFLRLLKGGAKGENETPVKNEKIRRWEDRLVELRARSREHLYLEDEGYYITHLVPGADREKYLALERGILAVGGNAEAVLAGLMDREQVGRFLGELKRRRREYGLRTVSFTLLPPYPEGFFPHHLLRHPWNYQNGGEWDWIGGRVVKALFKSGYRDEAEVYLLEIVRKNLDHFCIFEWEDRGGTGRGALYYVGAAGVLGEAMLMGYR